MSPLRQAIRAELAKLLAEHPDDKVLQILANAEASGMSRTEILAAIGEAIEEQDRRADKVQRPAIKKRRGRK